MVKLCVASKRSQVEIFFKFRRFNGKSNFSFKRQKKKFLEYLLSNSVHSIGRKNRKKREEEVSDYESC